MAGWQVAQVSVTPLPQRQCDETRRQGGFELHQGAVLLGPQAPHAAPLLQMNHFIKGDDLLEPGQDDSPTPAAAVIGKPCTVRTVKKPGQPLICRAFGLCHLFLCFKRGSAQDIMTSASHQRMVTSRKWMHMSHFQTLLCLLKAKRICLTGCLHEAQTSCAVIPSFDGKLY